MGPIGYTYLAKQFVLIVEYRITHVFKLLLKKFEIRDIIGNSSDHAASRRRRPLFWVGGAPTKIYRRATADTMKSAQGSTPHYLKT